MLPKHETLCPSGLRGWTQVPLAQAAWVQIPQVSYFMVLAIHRDLWTIALLGLEKLSNMENRCSCTHHLFKEPLPQWHHAAPRYIHGFILVQSYACIYGSFRTDDGNRQETLLLLLEDTAPMV